MSTGDNKQSTKDKNHKMESLKQLDTGQNKQCAHHQCSNDSPLQYSIGIISESSTIRHTFFEIVQVL